MNRIQHRTAWSTKLLATIALAFAFMPFASALLVTPLLGSSAVVYAAKDCPEGTTAVDVGSGKDPACLPSGRDLNVSDDCKQGECIIKKYVNPIINTLSIGLGTVIAGSIVVAGIQYGSSANNPQKVSAAKQRIVTSVFVLVGFFMLYAFLNWIIPGGLVSLK